MKDLSKHLNDKDLTVVVQTKITVSERDKLDAEAARLGASRYALIRAVIKDYLEEDE